MLLDMKKPQCEIFNKIELVKKYRERYPSKKYYNVVTDENRETLKQLDRIVDDINTLLQKGKKEEVLNHDEIQRITQLCNEAVKLIRLE